MFKLLNDFSIPMGTKISKHYDSNNLLHFQVIRNIFDTNRCVFCIIHLDYHKNNQKFFQIKTTAKCLTYRSSFYPKKWSHGCLKPIGANFFTQKSRKLTGKKSVNQIGLSQCSQRTITLAWIQTEFYDFVPFSICRISKIIEYYN